MKVSTTKKPSLFTAIAIGVGCIIGSGWLFASYYAAQYAGPISILAWVVGAGVALILALLLAEICTMYTLRGLFARLITVSHNRDYGFVVAISNWLGLVITIPSEAAASVQYLSTMVPRLQSYLFYDHHLTAYGLLCVLVLLFIYGTINFWGLKVLARTNNIIVVFKILVPLLTAIILLITAFHPSNFSAYHNSLAPYGIMPAFTAIVTCGIFYAFYGFGMIALFCSELDNPKRNIPIALITSILICLIIYLLLQFAFIGALPTHLVQQGWHNLVFVSPLAQLLLLLNLNFWAMVLYVDAAISPSGTAGLYLGSAARNFTGMAKDNQMPAFFSHTHPIYHFSRRSLILTMIICFSMVLFFPNWQKIMIVVTVFQLITCASIPVAFCKLRISQPDKPRGFRMPLGKIFSTLIFLIVSYLLVQAGIKALLLAFILHALLFTLYCISFYKKDFKKFIKAYQSSSSIFLFMIAIILYAIGREMGIFSSFISFGTFFAILLILFYLMVHQKNAQGEEENSDYDAQID